MSSEHTVLVGYGATGRSTARMLPDHAADLVVVDTDRQRAVLALRDGMRPVLGDGGDVATLQAAQVPDAACVVVAVSDDHTAIRVTTTARSLNRTATIITVVRDPRWRHLADYVGADQVIVAAEVVGRLLGAAVRQPDLPDRVMRALERPLDLVVGERAVRAAEVGRAAVACGPLVLAVVRNGQRLWLDDARASTLRSADRLLVLRAVPPRNACE